MTEPLLVLPRKAPLVSGTFLRRYKRFFADVRLDSGETVVAHCVNTGAMEGLLTPGARAWVSRAENPKRKLAFTWELVEAFGGRPVGVNTGAPNGLVGELLRRRLLSPFTRWTDLRPERPYDEGRRVDFWMEMAKGQEVYLEVKNCHLAHDDGRAYFPDCVSERAAHHLRALERVATAPRARAHVLFVVQIPDVTAVRPSDAHDPAFAAAARAAAKAGVGFSAVVVRQTPVETRVEAIVPVDLRPYVLPAGWSDRKGRADPGRITASSPSPP